MPTPTNTGNPTQPNYIPGMGEENMYQMDDTVNMPTLAKVSRWKELVRLPIPDYHRQRITKPNTHLGGVEVTTVIELTHS